MESSVMFYVALFMNLYFAALLLQSLTKGKSNREIANGSLGLLVVFTALDAVSLFLFLSALRQALLLLGWIGS